jgi:iron complex outermembrane recepter protein
MRFILALWICLFYTFTLTAQSISGQIIDKSSSKTIEGATIYLPELMTGTISDASGNFEIKNLKKGRYILQVSVIGFQPLIQTITVPIAGPLILEMQETTFKVDEIVVSAGRMSKISETPYQIQSIGADEINTSGNVSMMDALSEVAGIEQISYGTGIGKPVIRGLSFSRIMTIYRGMRFENQQWGEDHGLGVTSTGIDRVEVIKGPASLIYGSGAIGGVINLIDEKPATENKIMGDASVTLHSNSLGVNTDIGVKGTSEKGNFWILRSNMQNHADYIDGNQRTVGNSRFNANSIRADAGMIKKWGSMRFAYTFSQQKIGIIEEDEMDETLATFRNDRKMQLPHQNISDHLFSWQNSFRIGGNVLKVNLGQHFNLREEIEDEFDMVDLGIRLSTTTYDINYSWNPGENSEYTVGFQGFVQQNFNYENAQEILLPDAWVYDNGIFGLAKYTFGNLHLLAGTRIDYRRVVANSSRLEEFMLPGNPQDETLRRSFGGATGSLGISWLASKHWSLKSNIASGFRAPDLAELFSNGEHPGTNRFEIGNENFRREQNIEANLSSAYHSKHFSAEISGFYNHIFNYIYFSPTSEQINNLTIWRFYQNNARLAGGEAGFEFHPGFLRILSTKSTFSLVRGARLDDNSPLPLIPANRFTHEIKLTKNLSDKFTNAFFGIRFNHAMAQNLIADDEFATPAYFLVNLSAGSSLSLGKNSLDIHLAVNNLFNTAYLDHIAITRPFEIMNMGRNIRLTSRFHF